MDAIYGHQPASNGRESGLDSADVLLETFENESLSTCGFFSASVEPPSSPPSSPAPVASPAPAAASPAPPRSSTPSTSISSTQQRPVAAGKRSWPAMETA